VEADHLSRDRGVEFVHDRLAVDERKRLQRRHGLVEAFTEMAAVPRSGIATD
jgi:hypothetical protein